MEKAKVTKNILRSLMNIEPTKHGNQSQQPDNLNNLSCYSRSELQPYLDRIYLTPGVKPTQLTPQGIMPYLLPTHSKVGTRRVQTDKMRVLSPEIEQSRVLVSSSIMSPNDLQDGEYIFAVDHLNALKNDAELQEKITEVYHHYFNEVLQLGIKSYDWIGEVQYSSGCKPILILPPATQQKLSNRTMADVRSELKESMEPFTPNKAALQALSKSKPKAAFESFEQYMSSSMTDDDYLYSGKPVTFGKAEMEAFIQTSTRKVADEMDAKIDFGSSGKRSSRFVAGMEGMILNLRTRLEEGDVLRVTENPEILRFSINNKHSNRDKARERIRSKYNQDTQYPYEYMVNLELNPDDEHFGHPSLIELPPESVVPISIAGSPQEHFGYFILIGADGQPLDIETSGMGVNGEAPYENSNTDLSYEAVFGSGYTNMTRFFGSNRTDAHTASSIIFEQLLEKYLRSRINGIVGRNDLSIGRFQAMSSALFYRLLARKRTALVYAPPELLHYLAFSYDKDGTGLPKTADIQFLLSLRSTYQIATVMAMANDAVEHRKITFDIDEKNANFESTMDSIRNIYVAKNRLSGSIDPVDIANDLTANSITLAPRAIPGLSGVDVQIENGGINSTRPDTELIEQLTNLLVSSLDVPPAALNQLSEPEYAKSLVTYNLFFAKKITRYQRIWCSQIESLIHDYVSFDPAFQSILSDRIKNYSKKKVADTNLPTKTKKLAVNNPNEYEAANRLISEVIDNISVSLPKPNIVADDAQFEQLNEYMGNVDTLAQKFFSDDMIHSDDSEASNALRVYRAWWEYNQLANYLKRVGSFNMIDIPSIEEFSDSEVIDFIQTMQNFGKHLALQRESMNTGEEGDDGWGSDSGGGDSFGDDSSDSDGWGDTGDDFGDF